MPKRTDARTRAIQTAGRLFQEQGYGATGLTQLIGESGTPKGSFYFHFPAGKEELAWEAIRGSGAAVAAGLRDLACRSADAPTLIREYGAFQRRALEESGYRQGCPIATVTLEMAAASEPIRAAAEAAFRSWVAVLAGFFQAHGRPAAEAAGLAQHVVVAMEGALLLARAFRSTAPLLETERLLVSLVA